jgi:hypothetical protein
MSFHRFMRLSTLFCFLALLAPMPAMAYIGPGAGLGLVGAFFGLTWAIGLGIVLTLLWPIIWLLRRRAEKKANAASPETVSASEQKE